MVWTQLWTGRLSIRDSLVEIPRWLNRRWCLAGAIGAQTHEEECALYRTVGWDFDVHYIGEILLIPRIVRFLLGRKTFWLAEVHAAGMQREEFLNNVVDRLLNKRF